MPAKDKGTGTGKNPREQTRNVPAGALVEDLSLYPRQKVDSVHVADLARALLAGANLPLIVVEEGTMRIVDGVHRARALRRAHGAEATVTVLVRAYASEDDLLLDAIRLNAAHGHRLTKDDRIRCVTLAEQRGIDEGRIALALCVRKLDIPPLRIRVASTPVPGPANVPGTRLVTIKRPLAHLAGSELTPAQAQATLSAPGTSYLLLAHQLRDGLRHQLLNLSDDKLVTALRELHEELDRVLLART